MRSRAVTFTGLHSTRQLDDGVRLHDGGLTCLVNFADLILSQLTAKNESSATNTHTHVCLEQEGAMLASSLWSSRFHAQLNRCSLAFHALTVVGALVALEYSTPPVARSYAMLKLRIWHPKSAVAVPSAPTVDVVYLLGASCAF